MRNFNEFSNNQKNPSHEQWQTNSPQPFPPQNIKVLIEVANSAFDFNLNKKIKMNSKVQKIHDITWNTSPISYQININANKLWVSSKLIAQITYTKGEHSKVYCQSLQFPWKKTCNLQYIYPPINPITDEKKHFEFTDALNKPIEHYEQTIYNNENLILDTISTKIVTSKEIIAKNNFSYLYLKINCEIFYRLFQYQVLKQS